MHLSTVGIFILFSLIVWPFQTMIILGGIALVILMSEIGHQS